MNTVASLRALAERAVPFLRDEGAKYDDDGSNEPLELAREIEAALASPAPSAGVGVEPCRAALQVCHDALMKFAEGAFATPPWPDLTAALGAAQDALSVPGAGVEAVDGNEAALLLRDLRTSLAGNVAAIDDALQHPAAPSVSPAVEGDGETDGRRSLERLKASRLAAPHADDLAAVEDLIDFLYRRLATPEQPATFDPEHDGDTCRSNDLYAGNSVGWWKSKADNYGNGLLKVCSALGSIGIKMDGSTPCWEYVAQLRPSQPGSAVQGEPREPDGYHYVYIWPFNNKREEVIVKDGNGSEWNGQKPLRSIPYYYTTPPPAPAAEQRPKSPSYDALLIIAQSVCGALGRAGLTDCDDPGEAIDVMRERYEKRLTEQTNWLAVASALKVEAETWTGRSPEFADGYETAIRRAEQIARQFTEQPGSAVQGEKAESKLANAGVFKGHHGLRGLAEADAFWDRQEYGTRLYYGDGGMDYLHRSVLRAAVELLDTTPPPAPAAEQGDGSLLRKPGPLPAGCYCKPGRCMAPVTMGRQTPCRDPEKAATPNPVRAEQPEGKGAWKLVPVEATSAMTNAYHEAQKASVMASDMAWGISNPAQTFADGYRAMLAAAPAAPGAGVGVDDLANAAGSWTEFFQAYHRAAASGLAVDWERAAEKAMQWQRRVSEALKPFARTVAIAGEEESNG